MKARHEFDSDLAYRRYLIAYYVGQQLASIPHSPRSGILKTAEAYADEIIKSLGGQ